MISNAFLYALALSVIMAGPCFAARATQPAAPDPVVSIDRDDSIDDSVTGPNGYVYRISPDDSKAVMNGPVTYSNSNNHSGIGEIQSGSIAGQARKTTQYYGNYATSSAWPR